MSNAVTLTGDKVALVPINDSHYESLWAVIQRNPEVYRYTTLGHSSADFARWFSYAVSEKAFVIVDLSNNQVVGSTRLYAIDERVRRACIGYTWLSPTVMGTGINTEAKLLLLTYAFEQLKFIRVAFEIDAENKQSRRAVEKLGAVFEGELRLHRRRLDGGISGTAIYSVLDIEWATLKENLQQRLSRAKH